MLLILLIMFPTLLASHDSDAEEYSVEKYPLEKYSVEKYRLEKYPVEKYPVEENYENIDVASQLFFSVDNRAGNGEVRVKRFAKKKRSKKGSKKRPKKRPKKGKIGKKGKRKCMDKKFSDEIKRVKGQLNNFVGSSSLENFKKNLRAEVAEATRVVPDLLKMKASLK